MKKSKKVTWKKKERDNSDHEALSEKPQTSIPLQTKSGCFERLGLPKVSDLWLFPLLKSESNQSPKLPLEERKEGRKEKDGQ